MLFLRNIFRVAVTQVGKWVGCMSVLLDMLSVAKIM